MAGSCSQEKLRPISYHSISPMLQKGSRKPVFSTSTGAAAPPFASARRIADYREDALAATELSMRQALTQFAFCPTRVPTTPVTSSPRSCSSTSQRRVLGPCVEIAELGASDISSRQHAFPLDGPAADSPEPRSRISCRYHRQRQRLPISLATMCALVGRHATLTAIQGLAPRSHGY
jgi:hypothetical protein